MAKFRVKAVMSQVLYVDIDAENEDDARAKARDIDGADFTPIEGASDWYIDGAEPLKTERNHVKS